MATEGDSPLRSRFVCLNLLVALGSFYLIYFMVAALLAGAFRITPFDGKIPFNFDSCCIHESKNVVTLLSLVLTYVTSTGVFLIFIRQRIWDFAITASLLHLVICCAVMQKFPTNWQWWIAFVCSLSMMITIGQVVTKYCLKEKSAQQDHHNLVTQYSI